MTAAAAPPPGGCEGLVSGDSALGHTGLGVAPAAMQLIPAVTTGTAPRPRQGSQLCQPQPVPPPHPAPGGPWGGRGQGAGAPVRGAASAPGPLPRPQRHGGAALGSGAGSSPWPPCLPSLGSRSRAGPPSRFLPSFPGTETELGGGRPTGASRSRRGGSGTTLLPKVTQPPGPHPSPREPGSQWEGDKWGGSRAVPRAPVTPAGHPLPATSVLPLMARSGNATPPAPVPGAPPRSPCRGLVQVRWGWGRQDGGGPRAWFSPTV